MAYIDQFAWQMANVPGVLSVASCAQLGKLAASGDQRGQPEVGRAAARPSVAGEFVGLVPEGSGLLQPRLHGAAGQPLPDRPQGHHHQGVVRGGAAFRERETHADGVTVRLASGNAGVQAATNEVLETTELPMMLYVYATIVLLVFLTYRDWRAMLACCLPLTLATFLGYWFMKALDIGLTVATLPVMVLAVGIGVDYAFYIYNRLQMHLAQGVPIVTAFRSRCGGPASPPSSPRSRCRVGVATWSFSELKFQADMGLLLAFMFMVNMLMAITLLPSLAVMIDRTRPVRAPFLAH
jgi:hypothetical protein